ncbi:MAG: DUF4388 domain-containing protein [Meiothermus sp.]|uniref:DUF4388 domain-containing protein n=1 Tax=Meiothermus sp. TaxID=1955249 RepID=UPI0025F9CE51|nr:DUF4388 domain-containing protein [Meiothermus sp.]MCS7057869.1 DUF4388 domain-containing protein [Meiothermus sp.]MCS7194255.1 DUF4388 domain-containing protein [Meiothermus sp.]MDW8090811.1 DUF4388 domain-containing protein [Meiothermus sp.]MDW8480767.1 DUF4388 domain-containing protein [Meiothermus sp.]
MLSGNLAEFPLLRLLEVLMGATRGGALFIQHPLFLGAIYLQNGYLVHAEAGPLKGLEATELLIGVPAAPFRFEANRPAPSQSIEPSLSTHQLILHQFEAWREIRLPEDWGLTLRGGSSQPRVQLSPLELRVLAQAEGKRIAQVLMGHPPPLEAAQVLAKLLKLGFLGVQPQPGISPETLVVLSLYGKGEGVAVVDEELFERWQALVPGPFRVRVRTHRLEASLHPEARPHMQGRLGLFETDLRRLQLSRGVWVEAWPEPQT